MRDSKERGERNYLVFTLEEWNAFVDGVKNNEFDL
jgi:Domain of unknown function (DUF397).